MGRVLVPGSRGTEPLIRIMVEGERRGGHRRQRRTHCSEDQRAHSLTVKRTAGVPGACSAGPCRRIGPEVFMRAADNWKDYELIDATDGNRLERWGKTILVRPDPQVIWKTGESSPLWKSANAVYHRSAFGRRTVGIPAQDAGKNGRSPMEISAWWCLLQASSVRVYFRSRL